MVSAFKPMGKIMVVAGSDSREAAFLRRILAYGGRTNIVVSDSAGADVPRTAVLLMAGGRESVSRAGEFAVCVMEYSLAQAGGPAGPENTVTYSVDKDGADFTARNIRLTQDGLAAFEIVGVGIIGRVRLKTGDKGDVLPALAAATAAIAAGIPFAEVLEALNGMEIGRL